MRNGLVGFGLYRMPFSEKETEIALEHIKNLVAEYKKFKSDPEIIEQKQNVFSDLKVSSSRYPLIYKYVDFRVIDEIGTDYLEDEEKSLQKVRDLIGLFELDGGSVEYWDTLRWWMPEGYFIVAAGECPAEGPGFKLFEFAYLTGLARRMEMVP